MNDKKYHDMTDQQRTDLAYYAGELARVGANPNIQITSDTYRTNYLDLNKESIRAVIDYLKALRV